jgi:predicted RNA-binding Zn-ribbon protein involved in translation (DUF1610 family)
MNQMEFGYIEMVRLIKDCTTCGDIMEFDEKFNSSVCGRCGAWEIIKKEEHPS